ncbi:MAG: AMP-binding protein, partial [Thermoplasmatota archaeon]
PDPRKLEEVMKIIDKHGIHFLNCVPVFFQKFATHKNLSKYDLSSLCMSISGGESLPKETVDIFEKNAGSLLIEGYGLTEASPVTHINPPTKAERKIGSIGVTIPGTKAKIVNTETREEITIPGSPGELLIKGPGVMKGYWNNEEETKDSFQDGWLRTGDVAAKDEHGYFTIMDRLKDMVVVSGYKVWPNEVEEILLNHPSILEAAVVGIKTKIGTKLKATIVTHEHGKKLTLEEIRTYCKKFLAPYKVPKLIEYRDELPRSSVGKVLRRELRGDAT